MNLPAKTIAPSLLMDPASFDHMQRVGRMLALSPLFPEHLRKGSQEAAVANGVLVMNMAARLNEDPLTIAQNIYFVSGKPGWSSSYMIGKTNQHGVFKNPISWEMTGKGDDLSVTAYAELASTGKRVEATCGMAMARAEGWIKNPKYKSMPEQMLRYRSATFLIRLYCPEVMVGLPAQVEVELGMKDVTPADYAASQVVEPEPTKEEPIDADLVEDDGADQGATEKENVKAQSEKPEPEDDRSAPTADQKPKEQAETHKVPDQSQFESLFEMIKGDLAEAPTVDDVIALYGVQIEQMKAVAPDLHHQLEEEIKAYRDQEEAQG